MSRKPKSKDVNPFERPTVPEPNNLDAAVVKGVMAFTSQRTPPAPSPNGGYGPPHSTDIPSRLGSRADSGATSVDTRTGSLANRTLDAAGIKTPINTDVLEIESTVAEMNKAIEEPWNDVSGDDASTNGGVADRVRHWIWQTRLTKRYGPVMAGLIGLAHEIEGTIKQTKSYAKKDSKDLQSLDDLFKYFTENYRDMSINAQAQVSTTLGEYVRNLADMSELSDDEIREVAVARATGVPVKEIRKRKEAYMRELKKNPEFIKWQDATIDAAMRGAKPPPGPSTLHDFIVNHEFRKAQREQLEAEEELGKRNLK